MLSGPRLNRDPQSSSVAKKLNDGFTLAIGQGTDCLALRDGNSSKKLLNPGFTPAPLSLQQLEDGHVFGALLAVQQNIRHLNSTRFNVTLEMASSKPDAVCLLKRNQVLRLLNYLSSQLYPRIVGTHPL